MLPSMTKGEIVASKCLIGVVIDLNISLFSLVSTISYSITCLEALCVEDIEKTSLCSIDSELYAEEQSGRLLHISSCLNIFVCGLEVI